MLNICRMDIFSYIYIIISSFVSRLAPAEVARNDTCPELPEIANGWKSTSHPELVQGTVVTYQCYPGYQVAGAELLMCQWDLTWSGDIPSCERSEFTNTNWTLETNIGDDIDAVLIDWYNVNESKKKGQLSITYTCL